MAEDTMAAITDMFTRPQLSIMATGTDTIITRCTIDPIIRPTDMDIITADMATVTITEEAAGPSGYVFSATTHRSLTT
jgi:hypothetical protein